MISLLNAGCLLWLLRLQPVFALVAAAGLLYQIWLVRRSPRTLRKRGMRMILAISAALNILVIGGWIALSIRYR